MSSGNQVPIACDALIATLIAIRDFSYVPYIAGEAAIDFES